MKLVFDIETNGLYFDLTQIHCVVIQDLGSGEITVYNDEGNRASITQAATFIDGADLLIGHNIIGYDMPVMRKFFPFLDGSGKMLDTLVLSRLRYPNLILLDKAKPSVGMPEKLHGRHSLEAWGYRLSNNKGSFAKATNWQEWSPEMEDYCIQDVKLTNHLWSHFHQTWPGLP
jgi:hypothetical protein